jgi:hypothetical protein
MIVRLARQDGDRVKAAPVPDERHQFLHLVRLAWGLHERGVGSMIDLSRGTDPAVVVHRAAERLKILATRRGRKWVFTWGRGCHQWAPAEAKDAVEIIAKVAAR